MLEMNIKTIWIKENTPIYIGFLMEWTTAVTAGVATINGIIDTSKY